jgi:hypothetical protein
LIALRAVARLQLAVHFVQPVILGQILASAFDFLHKRATEGNQQPEARRG